MALGYSTEPGDIDHLIADDHAIVERQFQHLEAGRGDRRALVDQVGFELALHAFAEETVLYPKWLELGMEDENRDAREEHNDMKTLLLTLDRNDPGSQEFEDALTESRLHDTTSMTRSRKSCRSSATRSAPTPWRH